MTDPVTDPFADSRRAEETFRLEPAPDWVERCEIPWDTAAAPDDHVVAILNHTQWAPERSVRHERSVRRLITREAVQSLSQVELNWDPAIETLIIHELGIWREGVKRDLTERSRFLLRQREGSFEQNLVHGRMSALVMIDDVRPGDSVELEFSVISQARLPGEKFDFVYATERTVTTGKWIVSLFVPDTTHFEWRGSSPSIEAVETRSELTGERVHTFSGKQESPAEIEGGIPIWFIPYEHFEVTGYHSWNEVAKCLALAWDTVPRDRDALRQFAEEVCREASSLEDKARALVDWVQEHIRYLGMVGGAGGLKPQSPNLVLERRYGDCKDKTLLLCSLLTEIGVTAEPLLVHTIRRQTVGTLLPAMGAFDHVIATFEIEGRTGFVDPTMAGDGGGLFDRCLPPYGMGLPVNTEATEPVTIPDLGPELNALLVTEDFHLDHSRDLSYVDWRIEAVGGDANLLRARMRAVGGEVFAKTEAEDLRQSFSTARHVGPAKWIDDPSLNRVIVWGRTAFADWGSNANRGQKTFQYKPRWIYHALSAPSMAETRRFPFQLVVPALVRHEIRVHKKRHGFSQTFRLQSDNSFFRSTTVIRKASDQVIEAIYAYQMRVGILKPDQVQNYWIQLNDAVSNQLGLTLALPGKSAVSRTLPENFEKKVPPRDESGIPLPQVDPSARVNAENWIVKPAQVKASFFQNFPRWAVPLIFVVFVGTIGKVLEPLLEDRPDKRSTSTIPEPLSQHALGNVAYRLWEDSYFNLRFPETTEALKELTRIEPQEPRTFYAAAVTSLSQDKLTEAERFLQAIPISSRYFEMANTVRGHIAYLKGDIERASAAAKSATSSRPEDPMGWTLTCQVAGVKGNANEAVESIREAVRLDPQKLMFRLMEVLALAELPDQSQAFEAALKAERDFPDFADFTMWLADYHTTIGNLELGVSKARSSVERTNGAPRTKILLARLLAKSQNPEDLSEAASVYDELTRSTGNQSAKSKELAQAAVSVEDFSFATEVLRKAVSDSPSAELLAELAIVAMYEGKLTEARKHLETAFRIDLNSTDARRAQGMLDAYESEGSVRFQDP